MLLHATATTRTDVDIRPLIPGEQAALAALRDLGVVRHSFIRTDHAGAYFLLDVVDRAEADRHMATLPFVEKGIMTFDYVEVVDPQAG